MDGNEKTFVELVSASELDLGELMDADETGFGKPVDAGETAFGMAVATQMSSANVCRNQYMMLDALGVIDCGAWRLVLSHERAILILLRRIG